MNTLLCWTVKAALLAAIGLAGSASAHPVIYTLRTVADGKLGNLPFSEALVTIQMKADTSTVETQPSSNGGFLYTNRVGTVTVSVHAGGRTRVATFLPGEVYVSYDTGIGIAGFASAISPSYPIMLDCSGYTYPSISSYTQDCLYGDRYEGTIGALQIPGAGWSAETLALPKSLTQDTLLTGTAHTCATIYTHDSYGDLLVCSAPAPRGLRTDHGGLFLQDQIGGSSASVGPFAWNYWDIANKGSLKVELVSDD